MNPSPVRDLLGRHGLRCTLQRELVYSSLMGSKVHPTAEELHLAVNRIVVGHLSIPAAGYDRINTAPDQGREGAGGRKGSAAIVMIGGGC